MTIEEFIDELRAVTNTYTSIKWELRDDDHNDPVELRAVFGNCRVCPITAVYWGRTMRKVDAVHFEDCLDTLDVSLIDAHRIVNAADGASPYSHPLRDQLLAACGLKQEP